MTKKDWLLTKAKFLRSFFTLVYFTIIIYSTHKVNGSVLGSPIEAESLSPDSGGGVFEEEHEPARVKKGGALINLIPSTPFPTDLLLQKRHGHNGRRGGGQKHDDDDALRPQSLLLMSPQDHPNSLKGHHEQMKATANKNHKHVNKHLAGNNGSKIQLNRFYYFNAELPATQSAQFSLNKDLVIKTHHHPLPVFKTSAVIPSSNDDDYDSNHNKKRNIINDHKQAGHGQKKQGKKQTKKLLWTPIFVQNKNGPYHLHMPISRGETPRAHVDYKDLLQLATRYKNPLDFNFVPLHPSEQHLSRHRRGLGNWIKKHIFHIQTKTTPKPSPPPPPSSKSTTTTNNNIGRKKDYYDDDDSYYYDEDDEDDYRSFEKKSKSTKKQPLPLHYDDDDHNDRQQEEPVKSVKYITDQHGDTEIDWLLPKSLRKSTIMGGGGSLYNLHKSQVSETTTTTSTIKEPHRKRKRKFGRRPRPHKTIRHHDDYDDDYFVDEEPGQDLFLEKEPEPSYRPTKRRNRNRQDRRRRLKFRRRRPSSDNFDRSDDDKFPSSSSTEINSESRKERKYKEIGKHQISREEEEVLEPEMRRFKRSFSFSLLSTNGRTDRDPWKIDGKSKLDVPLGWLSDSLNLIDDSEPIQVASKEELRLLHELFMNIVHGKCPQSFDPQFVDTIEQNLFHIIDASSRHTNTDQETSSDMSTLIHELSNCSVMAETERDSLDLVVMQEDHYVSNTNDIEEGGPLYRSKRKFRSIDNNNVKIKSKRKGDDISSQSPGDLVRLTNFEFALITFVGEQCKKQVKPGLFHSASQLILDTIQDHSTPSMKLHEGKLQRNLNVLKKCTNLIVRHRKREVKLKQKLQNSFNLLYTHD